MKWTDVVLSGILLALAAGCSTPSSPQWMVCANDQRHTQVDGNNRVYEDAKPGSLTLMDVSSGLPRTVETLENVPCSLIGPPTCVAVAPSQKFALVAAAQKVDPDNPSEQIPDNKLSVVRLEKGAHEVFQTLELGVQTSGVEISRDGTRALITNRGEGTITLLELNDEGVVKVLGTFKVSDEKSNVSHAAFSPDGSLAIATLQNHDAVALLSLKGDQINVVQQIEVGDGPYCVEFLGSGDFAVVANALGGSLMLVEVKPKGIKVVDTIPVGIVPEGIDISPDGKWMVANCLENTSRKPTVPSRRQTGMLVLMEKQGQTFVTVDVARIGRIPQTAVFTPDSRFVAVGSNENQDITFFKIKNGELKPTGIQVPCSGGPAAMRIAN
ncbi:lactonase family protein [Tichowtungia aerotolerans]|uniref:Uncharacterized protein n=1 Tax=Tichowtungia aerotolerans TaxID=2697043 RepID=A0A6P1M743_9BACT|nr:hypothetical protein [Tichowtungia aerotolerans]QHI69842.1 hypothetical protein GT409_10395 [Tichowtungia aerotolerans]